MLSKFPSHKLEWLKSPLKLAVQRGRMDNVMILLDLLKDVSNLGYNLLDEVIKFGNVEVIARLISLKVHNLPNTYPLHVAVKFGTSENLHYLLQTGLFDINQLDN